MLLRMWTKWNQHPLLMGIKNGTAALGNRLAIPQKIRNIETPYDPEI
jgi:hypothetical protein